MPTRRSLIVALVGLNLFLLAALILSSYSPPAAYAQRAPGSWNFIAVTCEVDQAYDAFYLIDLGERRLSRLRTVAASGTAPSSTSGPAVSRPISTVPDGATN